MSKTKRMVAGIITVMMLFALVPVIALANSADVYQTPIGFNDNDYQKLVKFALQDDNLAKLGWDLSDPLSWGTIFDIWTYDGVIWNNDEERRVERINWAAGRHSLISHLTGPLDVSDFITLEILGLFDNQLTAINLTGNTGLRFLSVEGNPMDVFDVSDNLALEGLRVENSLLSELDVSKNVNLARLSVGGNELTVLNVSNLGNLWDLRANNNLLSELDLSNNIALDTLRVEGNFISELDLSFNSALASLDISNNKLTEIDLSNNTNLFYLNASNNLFTEIDVSNSTRLTQLNLSNNKLTEIDVSKNVDLQWELDISNNLLTDISSLENLENLISVDVSRNYLDLNNPAVQNSINKIQETITKNHDELGIIPGYYDFIYTPQNTVPGGGEDNPSNPINPNVISTPEVTAEPTTTEQNIEQETQKTIDISLIQDALNEENPRIILDESTGNVISIDALQLIRESAKTVEIVLANGLVITIDPTKITDSARAVDLNIDIIFSDVDSQFDPRIPLNSILIIPSAHGDFGFEISFNISKEQLIKAGLNDNNPGLFYIDNNSNIVSVDNVTINENGSLTVAISHASYYVLTDEKFISADVNQGVNDNYQDDINPATGVIFGVSMMVLASGATILIVKKKARK